MRTSELRSWIYLFAVLGSIIIFYNNVLFGIVYCYAVSKWILQVGDKV